MIDSVSYLISGSPETLLEWRQKTVEPPVRLPVVIRKLGGA